MNAKSLLKEHFDSAIANPVFFDTHAAAIGAVVALTYNFV